jgi:hypothetical protein
MRRSALLATAVLFALSSCAFAQSYDDVVAALAAQSPFIFLGKAGSGTAVHVETIFRGADTIGAFTNQDVLIVRPPGSQSPRAIFFVTPINYGKLMTAREDGELAPPEDLKTFSGALARADQAASDRKLRELLDSAETVVVARVVRAAELIGARRPSEHDPAWSLAVIEVERVLKSEPRTNNVLFAGSDDIRWFHSPKLHAGDEGIFLLRHDTKNLVRPGETPSVDAYILIDPADFRPLSEEERIVALLH